MTKKRSLSWLGGIVAAASSLMLLSMLRSWHVVGTAAVSVPESLPSVRPAGNEPETSTSNGTTVVEHAAVKPNTSATLSELLADNHTLLEVIGVFTAVSVFARQSEIPLFAYVLSFLFTTLVIILCVELWTRFPRDTDNLKVMLFKGVLTAAVVFLLLDLFIGYRDIWKYFLFLPIFGVMFYAVLMGLVVPVLRKTPLRRNKTLLRLAAFLIVIVLGYFSMRLAVLVEPGVNRFLDAVNRVVSSWTD